MAKFSICVAVMGLLAGSCWAGEGMELSVSAGKLAFKTPAVQLSAAQPAVAILEAGKEVTLTPTGEAKETAEQRQTPMGPAEAKTWQWDDARGYSFTWTVSRLAQRPGFTMQMTFTNRSKQPVTLRELIACRSEAKALTVEGSPADWWISTLDSHDSGKGGFNPSGSLEKDGALKFLDTMTLYSRRSSKGLLIGAAGPAEADVRFRCTRAGGAMGLDIYSDMTDITVDPGETRRSEETLVLAEPFDPAVAGLMKWIAATHGSRTARGPIFGWCSWYTYGTKINETEMNALVQAAEKNRDRLPMQVIQIDDGWQVAYGDWAVDAKKFPNGMKPIADKIKAAGAIPGIWLCMVRTSKNGHHLDGTANDYQDSSNPKVREYIRKTLQEQYAAGYRYFKLDFNTIRTSDRYDRKKTRLQISRDLFKLYRESIGEDCYLLACVGGFNRGCIGHADAARIGTDSCAGSKPLYKGCAIQDCINATGSLAMTNGILFAADPDVTYLTHKTPLLRTWHAYVGLLGGLMMTSDKLQQPPANSDEAVRMMEILNPPAPEKGRAFDGQTDEYHRQFGIEARRPWGNFVSTVLGNPSQKPGDVAVKGVPLELVGKKFHVWSFWDEKYLGVQDENFVIRNLPAWDAAVLRLTALPEKEDQPVLVGSSLHITMGSAEIRDTQTTPQEMTLTLTDGGARSGKLVIYSPKILSVKSCTGCKAQINAAGEHLWTVAIEHRQRGVENRITLAIQP